MARQLSERGGIPRYFTDLKELLEVMKPDVVHLTTPPQSHFALGSLCLEHGCHVYIEKPFTVNAAEAEALIELANSKGLKLTAGHDDQFRHAARRMRSLIGEGFLGGPPVHMESYYCYELGPESHYAKALLADKAHWVRALPGQLLQNIISHGIARIAEFMSGDNPEVFAYGFVSKVLGSLGETEIIDELRVIIRDENGATAYFTFSSQMRPALHQFRIYGSKNGLVVDQDNETLIKVFGKRRKSYLEHFVSPLGIARQYVANVRNNLRLFLARDFQMKAGMKYLIDAFYSSIRKDAAPPIPYREILLVARIMDAIFSQLPSRSSVTSTSRVPADMLNKL